jgi:spore germination cell wall hydrolase CwlJ-like protein
VVERRWGRSAPRKPDFYAAATFCLAKAIYYEARSEPLAGRLAVGRVIMNRVKSRFYPNSICEVVYQNAQLRNRCQFSFACDGKPDVPRNMRAWTDAVRLSEQLLCRGGLACKPMFVGGQVNISTHYHATYVKPRWSNVLPRTGQIGHHIFYFTASR